MILDPREVDGAIGRFATRLYRAGVGTIQLRAKGASDDELRLWGFDIAQAAMECDALFIMNDRVDLALEVGADGVHLGPDDTSIESAKSADEHLIVGGSAGTVERARALETAGADYLGCGAIWDASPSKDNASEPRGLEMISAVSAAVNIPIVGIGGVTLERAASVIRAGAAGVAVIRAVVHHDDPPAAARELAKSTMR